MSVAEKQDKRRKEVDVPTRTKVNVGVAWTSRSDPKRRHHIVVIDPTTDDWRILCSTGRGLRQYAGWLEVTVDCPLCIAAWNRGEGRE